MCALLFLRVLIQNISKSHEAREKYCRFIQWGNSAFRIQINNNFFVLLLSVLNQSMSKSHEEREKYCRFIQWDNVKFNVRTDQAFAESDVPKCFFIVSKHSCKVPTWRKMSGNISLGVVSGCFSYSLLLSCFPSFFSLFYVVYKRVRVKVLGTFYPHFISRHNYLFNLFISAMVFFWGGGGLYFPNIQFPAKKFIQNEKIRNSERKLFYHGF